MLEYLLRFIEQNLFFIFIIIFVLAICSTFSKKVKVFFVSCLIFSGSYFALLCLYELGIGIDYLYQLSCKYMYMICFMLEQIILLFNYSDSFNQLIQLLIRNCDGISTILNIIALVTMIYFVIQDRPNINVVSIRKKCNIEIKFRRLKQVITKTKSPVSMQTILRL